MHLLAEIVQANGHSTERLIEVEVVSVNGEDWFRFYYTIREFGELKEVDVFRCTVQAFTEFTS